MRRIFILSSIFLLASCATTAGNYSKTVQSWQGGNVNTLLQTWGKPNDVVAGAQGNSVYVYKSESYRTYANNYSPAVGVSVTPTGVPVMTAQPTTNMAWNRSSTLSCITAFVVNPKGIIINTKIQGTDCHAEKNLMNPAVNQSAANNNATVNTSANTAKNVTNVASNANVVSSSVKVGQQ
ncbi:MAG TPA: hypothetical protein VHZ76_03120 [Gammaproteobacteria bacterium]|nr:hypothetical protein [Gammaproteobacteria bacterium]